jgi:hypothetical protein
MIDADYPMETYFKKNPTAGKRVNYARICLNPQFHLQKSALTTEPAFVSRMTSGFIESYLSNVIRGMNNTKDDPIKNYVVFGTTITQGWTPAEDIYTEVRLREGPGGGLCSDEFPGPHYPSAELGVAERFIESR